MGEAQGRPGMEGAVYESALPWDPDRPNTAIISCVDGRWFRHFEDFARAHLKAGSRTDYLAVPGGIEPMTLFDLVPKDFNFFRRRLEALIEAHGTRRIVAIAHQDCAWYMGSNLFRFMVDLLERQVNDLRRVAERLREAFPEMAVET